MRRTGYTSLGAEHILLALIAGPDNAATEIIGLGEIPAGEIRAKIEEALAGGRSG